jgi:hypothetical protein
MEWADISALYRYWRDSPPVHELLAARWGVKARRGREATRDERPSFGISDADWEKGFAAGTPVPIGVM